MTRTLILKIFGVLKKDSKPDEYILTVTYQDSVTTALIIIFCFCFRQIKSPLQCTCSMGIKCFTKHTVDLPQTGHIVEKKKEFSEK